MISDNDLYTLAVFLGSLSMLLIVFYHYLEINKLDEGEANPVTMQPANKVVVEKPKVTIEPAPSKQRRQ